MTDDNNFNEIEITINGKKVRRWVIDDAMYYGDPFTFTNEDNVSFTINGTDETTSGLAIFGSVIEGDDGKRFASIYGIGNLPNYSMVVHYWKSPQAWSDLENGQLFDSDAECTLCNKEYDDNIHYKTFKYITKTVDVFDNFTPSLPEFWI